LILEDAGGKPLRSANLAGSRSSATLEYRLEQDSANYRLRLSSDGAGSGQAANEYRLVMGINAPGVLEDEAVTTEQPVLLEALDVGVGVRCTNG
jgi:hypothetical protein